jgi:CarD family transcriptional regulator
MPFQIGDRVVHPHHGVGFIVNVAEKQFEPGVSRNYYEISLMGSTLWVPVDGPGLGLRKLSTKNELDHCSQILQSSPSSLSIDPRQLRGQLVSRLKEGTITAQCEVVRDLTALGWKKPLYGAMAEFRRMTLDVLCQEWAAVAGIPLTEATYKINAYLTKGKQLVRS